MNGGYLDEHGVLMSRPPEWDEGCRDALKGLEGRPGTRFNPSAYHQGYEFGDMFRRAKEIEQELAR